MDCQIDYCIICGAPVTNFLVDIDNLTNDDINKLPDLQWLKDIILITENEIIKNVKYYEVGGFDLGEDQQIITNPTLWNNKNICGIVCHTLCYDLLKLELDINLNFNDAKYILCECDNILKENGYYDLIKKHNGDQFFYITDYSESEYWLLTNPFENEKNKKRILNYWKNTEIPYKKIYITEDEMLEKILTVFI